MAKDVCAKSNVRFEASVLIRRIAEPRSAGDSVKSAINRAAHRLSFSFCRAHSIWYRNARRINAEEMDALRREANKQAERYESIARAMESSDPDFHQQDILALIHAARSLRDMGSS